MPPPRTLPVVLAGFAAFLGLYTTQPLLPLLVATFDASAFEVSLTVTAPTIAVALAAPLVGRLADRLGLRAVIVGSAFALAIVTGLAATSDRLGTLVAWRFFQGLFTPGVFAVTIAYVHEQWPAARAGRALSAYVGGTVAGGFCGRAVAGLVAAEASWQTAFVVVGALNLAAALALFVWLPPERRRAAVRTPDRRATQQPLVRLLGNRPLAATYAVAFCVLFTQVAMFTYVTFHLAAAPYLLSTAALGWIFVVYLVGAIVTPLVGPWIDARGHRAGLRRAVAMSAGGALVTLAPPLAAIVAGLALTATGVFIAHATASSHVGVVTDRDRGLAVGLYATFYYAGGSLGGIVPAAIWGAGGWPACVALVVAVQGATVAIAAAFWTNHHVQEPVLPAAGV
jgi:predicted MFS family arabinose efflux permease